MIFSSFGSILGAEVHVNHHVRFLFSHAGSEAAAIAREGDTYAWLVRKVVCLSRSVEDGDAMLLEGGVEMEICGGKFLCVRSASR